MNKKSKLKAGDWVEVLSKEQILATLDESGQLAGLPFMPEMFQYCGRRMRVFKRAHKTCDTINNSGGRSLAAAVHLEDARCGGEAHGGCQAKCLIFWKEEWLRPLGEEQDAVGHKRPAPGLDSGRAPSSARCCEKNVSDATQL